MAEPQDSDICPKCQMPIKKTGSGSLTQWILVCTCNQVEEDEHTAEPLNICTACGKRIEAGRAGTLTQWIFRADLCSCANPSLARAVDTASVKTFAQPGWKEDEEEALEEMPMESGSFPIDRYAPLKLLGAGAAGSVYMCRDRLLEKRVAVKVLHNLQSDQLVSFQREAKATSQLNHSNIVKVLDFGVTDGRSPYMVMDYIAGINLETMIKENGPVRFDDALLIFDQICDALSYAHKRGLFHRDLKPSNIIVIPARDGAPGARLIDFGVGAFKQEQIDPADSQSKTIAGTPAYMSPDQASGHAFDARSEVYSLGCVMFETLTGRQPLVGDTPLSTISLHAHEPPPRLAEINPQAVFPEKAEKLIAKCLEKSPQQRYQSIDELKRVLVEIILAVTGDERRLTRSIIITPERTKSKIPIVLIAFVLICTLGIAVAYYHYTPFDEPALEDSSQPKKNVPKLQDAYDYLDSASWMPMTSGNNSKGWASNPGLTDADFVKLSKEKDFSSVLVNSNDHVTGVGFKYLVGKNIRDIETQSTALSDDGLQAISLIKSVSFLRVSLAPEITAKGLRYLKDMPNLRQLELLVMPIPKGAFDVIEEMPYLTMLSFFSSTGITTQDIDKLRALKQLHFIDVTGSDFGNEVIPHIAQLKSLYEFRGADLRLDDRFLELFGSMPMLRVLVLSENSGITDQGLQKLANCKQLKVLEISGCPKVTHKGISRLKKSLPALFVHESSI